MGWFTTSELDRFWTAAGGYLRSRAAENTLLLSAAQAVRSGQAPGTGVLYGWWEPPDGGDPRGAFLHDPGQPLLIAGRVPETAAALAATLAKLSRQVSGVDAPTAAADAFAAAWSHRARTGVRVHRQCRVYRLAAADPAPGMSPLGPSPQGVPGQAGRLRTATAADEPLLTAWLTAFGAETADRTGSPATMAAELISYGGAAFWEVPIRPGQPAYQPGEAAYQPVALAALAPPVAGTVRIAVAYTPPEHRHSGYASAVTLAVSRAVLSGDVPGVLGGAVAPGWISEVVLITDNNRPDRWGSWLGYQVVGERTVLRFGPATGALPRLQATGPAPRLPTGPLPRLPRLRG